MPVPCNPPLRRLFMTQQGSLKSGNAVRYAGILVGNVVMFGLLTAARPKDGALLSQVANQAQKLLPVGALSILAGLLVNQLSSTAKARLVFLRAAHPLPGCRAFSTYVHRDPRIDREALREAVGPFPVDPEEQNRVWYRLYKSVSADTSVMEAHRRFLFYRDYATMAMFIALAAVPAARQVNAALPGLLGVVGAAAMQLLLTIRAAQTSGEQLVCNVLATYATQVGKHNE